MNNRRAVVLSNPDRSTQEVDVRQAAAEACIVEFLRENPGAQSQSKTRIALALQTRYGKEQAWNAFNALVRRGVILRRATCRLNQFLIELAPEFRPPVPEDEYKLETAAS